MKKRDKYHTTEIIECPNCKTTKESRMCRELQVKLFDGRYNAVKTIYFCNKCDHYILPSQRQLEKDLITENKKEAPVTPKKRTRKRRRR